MIYRNSECNFAPDENDNINTNAMEKGCAFPPVDWNFKDGWRKKDNDCDKKQNCRENDNCSEDIKRRLSELQFAAIDLNLFLDTHPCDEEALKMYKKITKTIESVKYDYIKKYGPLMACDSSDETPFQWASEGYKWPWEK